MLSLDVSSQMPRHFKKQDVGSQLTALSVLHLICVYFPSHSTPWLQGKQLERNLQKDETSNPKPLITTF